MNTDRPIEELIIEDHNECKALLNKYRESSNREEALKWYHQFVWEVSRHAIAEELVLYPIIREKVTNGNVMADIAIDQHRQIKEDLVRIQSLNTDSNEFDTNIQIMWNDLIKHMETEESTDLKIFAQEVRIEDRINLGKKFQNRKLIAPTRPHTLIPDNYPTLEAIIGMLVAPYDKFKDLFTSFPDQKEVQRVIGHGERNLGQEVQRDLQKDVQNMQKDIQRDIQFDQQKDVQREVQRDVQRP